MKSSMSWQEVIDIYPPYNSTPSVVLKATQKGYNHKHNPTWKPAKPSMTPKQWHKANRKSRKA